MATTIAIFAHTETSAAIEYHGVFPSNPVGEFIRTSPRPEFKLAEDFAFIDPNGLTWKTPKEYVVNGASIPKMFWSFIGGPFSGNYINASIIHDYYCHGKTRTAHDTHRNFYYGMLATGVEGWKATAMHWAVSTFGPDWTLTKQSKNIFSCTFVKGVKNCNPTTRYEIIPSPTIKQPDLPTASGLTQEEVILRKFEIIVRTLKSSDGKYFDIANHGPIEANVENIEKGARRFKIALNSGIFEISPQSLGLLSSTTPQNLASINGWPKNVLPSFIGAKLINAPNTDFKITSQTPIAIFPYINNEQIKSILKPTLPNLKKYRNYFNNPSIFSGRSNWLSTQNSLRNEKMMESFQLK